MAFIFTLAWGIYLLIFILWYVLQVIAYWKVFSKAGQPGWKSLIPFYNQYVQFRISWRIPYMYWIYLACLIVGALFLSFDNIFSFIGSIAMIAGMAVNVLATIRLSRAFGHGAGFAVGLVFLGPIFMMILGFGSSRYMGPQY